MLNDQAKQERDSRLLPVLLAATEGIEAIKLIMKFEIIFHNFSSYFLSFTDREGDICLSNSCRQLS